MRQVWRMLLRNPGGLIGVTILTIAIAVALIGPLLFPTSPWRMVQRPSCRRSRWPTCRSAPTRSDAT